MPKKKGLQQRISTRSKISVLRFVRRLLLVLQIARMKKKPTIVYWAIFKTHFGFNLSPPPPPLPQSLLPPMQVQILSSAHTDHLLWDNATEWFVERRNHRRRPKQPRARRLHFDLLGCARLHGQFSFYRYPIACFDFEFYQKRHHLFWSDRRLGHRKSTRRSRDKNLSLEYRSHHRNHFKPDRRSVFGHCDRHQGLHNCRFGTYFRAGASPNRQPFQCPNCPRKTQSHLVGAGGTAPLKYHRSTGPTTFIINTTGIFTNVVPGEYTFK